MTELIQNSITCPKCASPLTTEIFSRTADSSCPHCGLVMTGRLFPRFFKPHDEQTNNTEVTSDSESSCFFHPNKLAVSHCSECGRFLCALCELNIQDKIICPTCLEKLDQEKKVKTFTNRVTFWDSIVLSLAILPMLFWPVTLFTAPLTLIFIWRHFKDTRQYLIPRNRWRFYIAGLLAVMQITGWTVLAVVLLDKL